MRQEVAIERLDLEHTQELFELTDSNRSHLREWLPWLDNIQTTSDTQAFIESTLIGPPTFLITYKGAACGVVGFHEINKQHNTASIGYWIAQNYTGKGLVTAAVYQLIDIGFNKINLDRIQAYCATENIKSRAIPERLGFSYETTLKQREWLYSKYVDHAVYSIQASEFADLEAKAIRFLFT